MPLQTTYTIYEKYEVSSKNEVPKSSAHFFPRQRKDKKKRKKINIPVHKPLASEFDFFG
jgi:hypothetical protein